MEDGGLGFAAVDNTIITLWSRETGPEGAETWTQRRVIDLKTLLSGDALSHSINGIKYYSWIPVASVVGFAEGTDAIFVGTIACVYMIELKSGRVRKVLDEYGRVCPYMGFYIPGIPSWVFSWHLHFQSSISLCVLTPKS